MDKTRGVELEVVVVPGATVPFDQLPPCSLALDGFVLGPAVDPASRRFSFDHHGDCLRLATSATCRQVLDALSIGLDPEGLIVYANDVDGDVVLSVALLRHPAWCGDPRVRRLVDVVATADAHGPAYPSADLALLQQFARTLAAVRDAGEGDSAGLLLRCVRAIEVMVSGNDLADDAATLTVPARPWLITRMGSGWVMVESDHNVLDLVYRAGHRRVVAHRLRPDGSRDYTVARQSDLVAGFPVGPVDSTGTILRALSDREAGWGGGSSIGGAPRHGDGSRSRLQPDEVFDIVEGMVVAQPDEP